MASEEGKIEGKGFTVQDRRRFSETGEARENFAESSSETAESSQAQAAAASEAHQGPLPEINFSTFVISLSTQALMYLGEITNPVSGKVDVDVPAAKQTIDILGMLKEKTGGNLSPSEDR